MFKQKSNTGIKLISAINLATCIFIALIIVVATFPEMDWFYSIGIDRPLTWLFNDLFKHNLALGKGIIFPHGPLAFFTYPLPENIILALVTLGALKFLLLFNLYWLWNDHVKIRKWIIIGVVTYAYSLISNFGMLILINILLLYCNYFNFKKKAFKYTAFCLTGFALFLKAYLAIVSGLLFFSFIIYWFYKSKSIKQLLADCFCLLIITQIIWILIYKSLTGFVTYIWGMYHLAQDNSSAVSYYPYNSWWILFLFFLLLGGVFIINRTKKSLFYLVLISLGLFAAWKHGMAREDFSHTHGLFLFTTCCLLVFILFERTKLYVNIILSIGILFLFSMNRKLANAYIPFEYKLFNGEAFMDFVLNFSKIRSDLENISQKNIAKNKLPASIRNIISNSTVDVYPWDYTIIAANKLNLRPRVVIQSYASYTSWLDAQNAAHFNSGSAPDFLIWELQKISSDVNEGDMNSIDDRYLLNDEPQTMLQILKQYDYFYSDEKFKIYKKRNAPLRATIKRIGQARLTWSQWVDVPDVNKNVLRAKLSFEKTISQKIKSFLYKDEQFWIYLGLKNGEIHKYRIVPKNAEDGLWIMPYIYNSKTAYTVEKIMLKCSNEEMLTDKLEINWEEVNLGDSSKQPMSFFHIKNFTMDSLITISTNDFEKKSVKYWNNVSEKQLSKNSFSGNKSYLLKSKTFSTSFSIEFDSLSFSNLKIIADCWVKAPDYKFTNKVSLILSVEDKNESFIWKAASIDRQLIDQNKWNNIYNSLDYKNGNAGRLLKIYLYNDGKEDVFIDHFRVMISKKD